MAFILLKTGFDFAFSKFLRDTDDDGTIIGGYGDHVLMSGEDMWDPISSLSAWFRSRFRKERGSRVPDELL